jgi:hypothetical protein
MGSENRSCDPPVETLLSRKLPMSVLAHGSTGLINTWGFAYVGGIVGLFVVSLLYVKARVELRTSPSGRVSVGQLIAAIGPIAIVVGGVCGVSLGLGLANVLESQFSDDAEVIVVVELPE